MLTPYRLRWLTIQAWLGHLIRWSACRNSFPIRMWIVAKQYKAAGLSAFIAHNANIGFTKLTLFIWIKKRSPVLCISFCMAYSDQGIYKSRSPWRCLLINSQHSNQCNQFHFIDCFWPVHCLDSAYTCMLSKQATAPKRPWHQWCP